MCSISGVLNLNLQRLPHVGPCLRAMNYLMRHRGPDGGGCWEHSHAHVGLGHMRLSIIDLSPSAAQPMSDGAGNWIVFNGEIYNYLELRRELGDDLFTSHSDTEVILRAYRRWGRDCVLHFRGMFAFAIWDEARQVLFCARDRFGIKPFYYTQRDGVFYLASEVKALLPFVKDIATDLEAFKDYLTFQLCLNGKTLFKNIWELPPAHCLEVCNGRVTVSRYWEVFYEPDFDHTERYFEERLRDLLESSVRLHLRSDVSIGAYVSGGLDSSAVASMAADALASQPLLLFTGKFSSCGAEFDESRYALAFAEWKGLQLIQLDIDAKDFLEHIRQVVYHLDFPVAGPGAFPQFMVSRLAGRHRKVLLGGQGGDEVFGGYTRYLIAYFEQCIKGAIDGTMANGNFIVTYESIIPNLGALRGYKGLLQEFWKDGLFDSMDRRYFRLINRAPDLRNEIRWAELGEYSPEEAFRVVFNKKNVRKDSYFDLMTHFDFKTLLPALLQVEDRMSMAHGVESRVPLLDHPLIELAATIPSNVKFKNGRLKHIFKEAVRRYLPEVILARQDKMGFPTPLGPWARGEARGFIEETLGAGKALQRDLIDNREVLRNLGDERQYGRRLWAFLCLELWQQSFHDREADFRSVISKTTEVNN